MLSVVIPVHDSASTLGAQLEALATQDFDGEWELVVADNGSTDASAEVARRYTGRIPGLRVVDASGRPGPSAARNIGAAAARGAAFAFCDADDVVAPGWLGAVAAGLAEHEFVTGPLEWQRLDPYGRQSTPGLMSLDPWLGFKPVAPAPNFGITRAAFTRVGGFDERLRFGEEIDLSWRLQLAGCELHFEPEALVHYRLRSSPREVWRQRVRWGMSEVASYKRFRRWGVPREPISDVLTDYLGLARRVRALRSANGRWRWLRDAGRRWGHIRGSIRYGVLFL
jgi:glycosyltransferase involved in cell wall biosynthesis